MQIISPDLITRLQKHMKILCLENTPNFYQSPDFLYQKYTRKYHQMSFIKIKANTVSQQEQVQEGQLFLSSPVSLRLPIFKWRYLPLQVFQSCNGTIIPKYPVMFLILRKQQKIWRLLLLKIQHKKWKDLLYKI